MAAIAAASSLSLGPSSCHAEGLSCSTSYGIVSSWMKSHLDGRGVTDLSGISSRNPLFRSNQYHWLSVGHDLCISKVSVAADHSDSFPDSSNSISNRGYHPLEELKVNKKVRDSKLTCAEIARTAVEANSSALLVFPGTVHSEPHEQISWAEFEYLIDDYGDIYFQIFNEENILQERGASNPVIALFGMDIRTYENRIIGGGYNISDMGSSDDILIDENYFEVLDSEIPDTPVDWGMPDTSSWVHPVYFAKCLTKAISMAYDRKMDHPQNGVSVVGCLRPAFVDEASYLRRLFHGEDSDGYNSDWKDEVSKFRSKSDESNPRSTLYRLEIMRIELFSMYGIQSAVSLQDFQEAEPDVLVHTTSEIVVHFSERGFGCNDALKAFCKKKGLNVEGANIIGVDSLGIDVRVFTGVEVQTHRFPFKVRATSEVTAEKQIQQLLFPRSRRKKLRSQGDGFREAEYFIND